MSFVYPRIITITRPGAQTGAGAVGYGGQLPASETVIASNIPASIQHKRDLGKTAGLPGDAVRQSGWQIMFTGVDAGAIKNRDIVIDEFGNRYQILAAYWNSLGWNCTAEMLEA